MANGVDPLVQHTTSSLIGYYKGKKIIGVVSSSRGRHHHHGRPCAGNTLRVSSAGALGGLDASKLQEMAKNNMSRRLAAVVEGQAAIATIC